ncbi:MAG: hypothetical protein ACOCWE_01870 [Bacillota bacterium]
MSEELNGILPVEIGLYKNELYTQGKNEFILTSIDIASGIGILKEDKFFVEAETIAYFTTRVAMLDLMAAGGEPVIISFATSLANNYYDDIEAGILKLLSEWSLDMNLKITGSTEDNFKSKQTSISIMITGIAIKDKLRWLQAEREDNLFIIGEPLVGEKVLSQRDKVISAEVFQLLMKDKSTKNIIPIGSGGAIQRIKNILNKTGLKYKSLNNELENISAGPATAVLLISNASFDYYRDKIDIPITYLGKLI